MMGNINTLLPDIKSFIPVEQAIAPKHPLAKNLQLPIPDPRKAKPEIIRAIQIRERIPGIVKRLIPLDSDLSWEYWWCVPGRLLLPEDVEVLNKDLPRLENIVAKLVWLFGGCCFSNQTKYQDESQAVYDWQQVKEFARQQGFDYYLLDIDFFPAAVKLYNPPDDENAKLKDSPEWVAAEPSHWHIEFFRLQPTVGGFEIQEPKPLCSCQIWTGKPFIKNRYTGETLTRHDLWISYPLNITNPPWLL
ncbi:MAG: hypothetical protein NZ660_09435 [Oscillatoriaceae bacterium SKYG93]|nr:hypothetical protein [Oscillatoriaceae bacterium SKYG93]MDW8453663.1 hypothetical protein [Oscillatoriaceae cyanobacterium SKYGB_i_bin93]